MTPIVILLLFYLYKSTIDTGCRQSKSFENQIICFYITSTITINTFQYITMKILPNIILLSFPSPSLSLLLNSLQFSSPRCLINKPHTHNKHINPAAIDYINQKKSRQQNWLLFENLGDSNASNDEEYTSKDVNDFDLEDWRAFRAGLVLKEQNGQETEIMKGHTKMRGKLNGNKLKDQSSTTEKSTKCEDDDPVSNSWVYESGKFIEQGTIILHNPPTDLGYGLGNQYLHKAVVIVLEHDQANNIPTRGVILNRPTDLNLYDHDEGAEEEENEFGNHQGEQEIGDEMETDEEDETTSSDYEKDDESWRIWFGGNDWGVHSPDPKFFCLHSLDSAEALQVSRKVVKGINFVSFEDAQILVENGEGSYSDFWAFCGFVSWAPGELMENLKEGLWHAVATDSETLKRGKRILNIGSYGIDPRDGGIQTWKMLMKLIGKEVDSPNHHERFIGSTPHNSFDDLMLKEWAAKYLSFNEAPMFLRDKSVIENEIKEPFGGFSSSMTRTVLPGMIVRASSAPRSPFLFNDHEYHKSLILILQDEDVSVGLILNQPSARDVELDFVDDSSFFKKDIKFSIPIRFGGSTEDTITNSDTEIDDFPLLILHMNSLLHDAGIGEPVGDNFPKGIYKCTLDDIRDAFVNLLALPTDFMILDGVCTWPKQMNEDGTMTGGIIDEIIDGNFEIMDHGQSQQMWDTLVNQKVLSARTIDKNLKMSNHAWYIAGDSKEKDEIKNNNIMEKIAMIGREKSLKNNYNDSEEGDVVFKSNVKVEELGDNALKHWILSNLLEGID